MLTPLPQSCEWLICLLISEPGSSVTGNVYGIQLNSLFIYVLSRLVFTGGSPHLLVIVKPKSSSCVSILVTSSLLMGSSWLNHVVHHLYVAIVMCTFLLLVRNTRMAGRSTSQTSFSRIFLQKHVIVMSIRSYNLCNCFLISCISCNYFSSALEGFPPSRLSSNVITLLQCMNALAAFQKSNLTK